MNYSDDCIRLLQLSGDYAARYRQFHDFYKVSFDKRYSCNFEIITRDEAGNSVVFKAQAWHFAYWSRVFHKMIEVNSKEAQEKCVKMHAFSPTLVREILRFIYYCKVKNFADNCRGLVFLSHKYKIDELTTSCFRKIHSTTTVANVLETLTIVKSLGQKDEIFYKCLEIIIQNYDVVSSTKEWQEFSKRHLIKRCAGPNSTGLSQKCLNTIIKNYDAVSESQDWKDLPKLSLAIIMKKAFGPFLSYRNTREDWRPSDLVLEACSRW